MNSNWYQNYDDFQDGVYWIRSITKDRYLDVAYDKKEDNAQIIGQTLNPNATDNQKWNVRRVGNRIPGCPLTLHISPVSDAQRNLFVNGNNVVTNSKVLHWTAIPTEDYRVFQLAPANTQGTQLLSVINSSNPSDWNVVVASDENINFTSEAPKNFHQLWAFIENPYRR